MPTADQYARYRQDRTTIWVSKTAAAFLARERETPGESVGTVLDRLLVELKRARRGGGGARAGSARATTKTTAKKAASRSTARKK